MFNLDEAIAEWRRQMCAAGIKSPRVLDELESHLREDVNRQVRSGSSVSEAFTVAVQRIGQAGALTIEFEKICLTEGTQRRKYLWKCSTLGACLFAVGIGLCYFAVLPLVRSTNELYAAWLGLEAPQWRDMAYVMFAGKLMLGFGAGFALPVVLLTFVKSGVLDYRRLISSRRYVIVFNLVLGALATTPEVITQLMMFIPLQLIYEVSVWLAWCSLRKESKCA